MAPRSVPDLPGIMARVSPLTNPMPEPIMGAWDAHFRPASLGGQRALAEGLMQANRQSDSTMLTVLIPAYNGGRPHH